MRQNVGGLPGNMEGDALQARRVAQIEANRQALQATAGNPAASMMYAPLVPPPGVLYSPHATPTSSPMPTPPPSDLVPRPTGKVDYSAQSGVFIPEGVRVSPPCSPATPATSEGDRTAISTRSNPVLRTLVETPLITPPVVRRSTRTLNDIAVEKLNPSQLAVLLPREQLLSGHVIRERGGLLAHAKYRYYFENPRSIFVLSSRKRSMKQTANYVVSLSEEDLDRDGENCFVKVRSNFSGTEFVFFTSDRDDKREIGAVVYEVNPGGIRGPRRLTVVLPRVSPSGTLEEWRRADDEDALISEFRENPESSRLVVLENKAPEWNESLQGFQLNFGGRIAMPSVKNVQLCDRRDPAQTVVFQFGKWSAERFSLDFRYPINATQAFCIALTSFDNKLLCE